MNQELNFEKAEIRDLDEILNLYLERSNWFKEKQIKQWNNYLKSHPVADFEKAIRTQNYYIMRDHGTIIAGFELSIDSKLWKEESEDVYYIRKVVTKVGYKNIGSLIFDKCKEIAISNNKHYLRLECIKSNKKLNEIYENYNFKWIRYCNDGLCHFSLRELKIN